jgi:hypothetical protein
MKPRRGAFWRWRKWGSKTRRRHRLQRGAEEGGRKRREAEEEPLSRTGTQNLKIGTGTSDKNFSNGKRIQATHSSSRHPFSAPSLPTPSSAFARERQSRRHDTLPVCGLLLPHPSPPGAAPSSSVAKQRGLDLPFTCDGGGAARPRPPHWEEAQGQKRWLSPPSTAATASAALRHCSVCVLGDGGEVDLAAGFGLAAAAASSSTWNSSMRSSSGLATEPPPSGRGRDGGNPNT